MENKHQQILSEMTTLLASLKSQVEELEIKLQEYRQMLDNQNVGEIVEEIVEEVVEPVGQEPVVEAEELVGEDFEPVSEEVESVPEEQKVEEVMVEMVETEEVAEALEGDMFEMEVMDIELAPSDDLPFYDIKSPADAPLYMIEEETPSMEEIHDKPSAPAVVHEEKSAPVAVIDAMTAKQAWRTDMPGSPVRDIRSAISLNDRILFINYLFGEDPIAFQDMLTQLNAMPSFNDAVNAVVAAHPEWDLESDTVYRFMMALRRRLQ